MEKAISLPRIRNRSELSKPLPTKERRNSFGLDSIGEVEPKREQMVQNDEQKLKIVEKNKIYSLKRANSQLLRKSNEQVQNYQLREKKYGLLQNGKLSKVSETTKLSKAQSSERSRASKAQSYDKQQAAVVKKELNEITSSILILKKQIKAIEGGTLQVKQQIKKLQQDSPQENSTTEQRIEQIRKRTENSRYQQDILKNMKDRLKKVTINYQKKAIQLKDTLEREERKIKILNQRSSIREQSINKQKLMVKVVEDKQKTVNRLTELALQDYQRKMKETNSQKEINQRANLKSISQNQYHLEVYKKEEAVFLTEMRANMFLRGLLQLRWNKYSQVYGDVEKAQKLMEMHSLDKNQGKFDPKKIYFGSFQKNKELESKIKEKEIRLAECMKRNAELQKTWESVKFKQIDEQEKIIDKKPLQIRSGKVQQKQVIEKQQREYILDMRRQLEKSKERSIKFSSIKDWVLKLQKGLKIHTVKGVSVEDRLISVINWAVNENKQQKNRNNITL